MMPRTRGSKNRKTLEREKAEKAAAMAAKAAERAIEKEPAKAAKGRSRAGEQRRERRRRDTEIDGQRMRLKIPPKYAEDKEYEYRWINDDKSRVHDLTRQDDWDPVGTDGEGANSTRRQVGTKPSGEPLFAHLVRKPKDWFDEDRAKQQAALDETMDQLAATGKRGDDAVIGKGERGYVAADVSIRDGRRS